MFADDTTFDRVTLDLASLGDSHGCWRAMGVCEESTRSSLQHGPQWNPPAGCTFPQAIKGTACSDRRPSSPHARWQASFGASFASCSGRTGSSSPATRSSVRSFRLDHQAG
jgi:hypothetical protein